MLKKQLSLKKRISIATGIPVFIVMSAMAIIIYSVSTDIIKEISFQDEGNLAKNSSTVIEGIFNHALDSSMDLAFTFRKLKMRGVSRDFISDMLKDYLEDNPQFIGVCSGWEPDAYDGIDSEFKNSPGHNSAGRILYYWTRAGGNVRLETLIDYEKEGGYYKVPAKTLKPHLTEPYFYNISGKDYFVVSAMVPILIDGKFHGVVGVDFTMDQINSEVSKITPYGTGYAFLCSNSGTVIAHPSKSFLGKDLSSIHPVTGFESMKSIAEGKSFSYIKMSIARQEEAHFVHVPTVFRDTSAPWSLAVVVPMDKVMEGPRKLRNYVIGIGILGIGLIILITLIMVEKSIRPVINMKDMMKEAAEGEADMTRRMEAGAMDEIGETAYWFNIFIERVQRLIVEVKSNTSSVSSAVAEISASTEELSKTVEEQSLQAQTVSTAISELSSTSSDISSSMEEAREISENSAKMTQDGSVIIEKSIESLKRIENHTGGLNDIVDELSESTSQISAIIEVINEVADQTNLLALNAAIEAARAGEHGRGFAVVADEVRNLAVRTASATDEIVSIIQALQKKSKDASKAMQETVIEVSEGTKLGQNSLEILSEIVTAGDEVQNSAETVAAAIEEENATITEISGSLESIASASVESSNAVHEVSRTADDLAAEAEKLKNLIDQFITE